MTTTNSPDWGFTWDDHDRMVPTIPVVRDKRPIPPPPSRQTVAFSVRLDRPEAGSGCDLPEDFDPLARTDRDIRDCFRVDRFGFGR